MQQLRLLKKRKDRRSKPKSVVDQSLQMQVTVAD